MNIIKLKVDNIGGIEAFEIEPNGQHVVIGGPNGAGKSTVLNSISGALGGARNRKSQTVKMGAERGEVVIDLGDFIVRWESFEDGRDVLTVTSADGAVYKSPQAFLKNLWGQGRSFDALDFFSASSKDQVQILADLLEIDIAAINKKRQELYDQRTVHNRMAKQFDAQAKGELADIPADTPEELIDQSEIYEELQMAKATNDENRRQRALLDLAVLSHDNAIARESEIEAEACRAGVEVQEINTAAIKTAEEALERARVEAVNRLHRAEQRVQAQRDEASLAEAATRVNRKELEETVPKLEDVDLVAIESMITRVADVNSFVAQKKAAMKLAKDALDHKAFADSLTDEIKELDDGLVKSIADADFPIEGLGLSAAGVTWREKPLELLSSSERIAVSTDIDIARHPDLSIMLLDKWGDLDEEGRVIVHEKAEKAGCQIFTTVVGDKDEDITIHIREGRIAAS